MSLMIYGPFRAATDAWRAGIEVVAIDMYAAYRVPCASTSRTRRW